MRVLPKPMREPVSLGYLLARASDTLADSEVLKPELRLEMLDGMTEVLRGGERSHWLERIKQEVVPCQTHVGERALLENLDRVLDWLRAIDSEEQQQAIHTVLKHIFRGQRLDIERFELQDGFCFTLDSQLEEYCYLVAGCVGEFWSEVGDLTLKQFSTADKFQLMSWGANYGKGLQLINILRDLPNDLQAGRCYLPHVDPEDSDAVILEIKRWCQQARGYLQDGASYAQSLRSRRTRLATALPGLIGESTLDMIEAADWPTLSRGIKIDRSQVYQCAWQALIS